MGSLRRESIAMALVLLTEILVGLATGVQRTILGVASHAAGGSFLLPIVSFGAFKATFDLFTGLYAGKSRRKSLLTGTLVYTTGAVALLLLPPPLNFLVGNIFVGAGEGLVFATSALAIRDILGLERSSLSFGYIESACYFGYSIGAFVSGLVYGSLGAPATLFVILASSVLGVVSAASSHETMQYTLQERERFSTTMKTSEIVKLLFSNPSTASALLAAHMAKVADSIAWGVIPVYMVAKGLQVYHVGFAQSLLLLVWSSTMPFWSSFSDRVGRRALATLGLMINGALLIALPGTRNFPEMLLIVLVMGLSYAMYYPILPAPVADMTPPEGRDLAVGVYRALRDSGYATGALIATLILSVAPSSLDSVFIDIGSMLVVTAAAFSIVFRETRPTWPFLNLVIRHVEIIRDVLVYQQKLVEKAFGGYAEELESGIRVLKDMERKADAVKREVTWRIYSGLLPTSSRIDFERLVEEIDKVAGAVIECNERLLWVKHSEKLRDLKQLLLEMLNENIRLADMLIENLRVLSLSPLYAVRASIEIDAGERRVDELRIKAIHMIRKLLDENEIDIMSALSLMEAVNLLELTSDDFQDAADIIRIISYRHAALPPDRIARFGA
ncbi:MFS transporter [Thermofilum pendens]|uniref:Major facilitator superfamily MFS_1 n=1 Tax=Thermofilum pendens (strain DSM 2475 / Hrk 5) TaxID=368408 RepID=A1RYH3_THEPD|nr:MFS transporter [Thermofilum pendens]ABL78253.1 major facilitator superfamily MFS_1 [Thermofilum pendens Hrk 5]